VVRLGSQRVSCRLEVSNFTCARVSEPAIEEQDALSLKRVLFLPLSVIYFDRQASEEPSLLRLPGAYRAALLAD
jgi:hypothetical protein